jgi:hypothetical protein
LERWQEAFSVDDEFWVRYHAERDRHRDLLKKWNAIVQIYNARVAPSLRNFGRPVAASRTQKDDVLKRRKAGGSLRSIAGETGLGLQTVRTIIDKRDGLDRATAARLKRILPDKLAQMREVREDTNRRARKYFPKQVAAALKEAEGLRKELKGMGAPTRSNRR